DAIRESPRGFDEDTIGGWNQRLWLAPGDVPNTRQISSLQHRQLRYGNFPKIHRVKIAIGPVEARARFIDQFRRLDPFQGQLDEMIACVVGSSVNAELAGPHDIRLIEDIAAI